MAGARKDKIFFLVSVMYICTIKTVHETSLCSYKDKKYWFNSVKTKQKVDI